MFLANDDKQAARASSGRVDLPDERRSSRRRELPGWPGRHGGTPRKSTTRILASPLPNSPNRHRQRHSFWVAFQRAARPVRQPSPPRAACTIVRERLAKLAELYDQCQHSLRPLSPQRAAAGKAFQELPGRLHATHAAAVTFAAFRREPIFRSRESLKKNRPA
jgi:hypothetical protein